MQQTFLATHNRHRTHAETLTNQDSPQIKKVRQIKAQTELKPQLSGFDLITWNQHSQYRPNQILKKIKLDNDLSLHRIANQKVRIMPKQTRVRGKISPILLDSRAYPEHLKQINNSEHIRFLTDADEEVLNHNNTPSVRSQFKLRYPTLWEAIDRSKEKINPNTKSRIQTQKLIQKINFEATLLPRSQSQAKDHPKTTSLVSKQKIPRLDYFVTAKEPVNRRMEEIIRHWKKQKKSVNERYYDIWVKPKHKQQLRSATQPLKQQKHSLSRFSQSVGMQQSAIS